MRAKPATASRARGSERATSARAPRSRPAPPASATLLDVQALPRALSARDRGELRAGLRGLLRFHRSLASWPALRAPRATPIVAIYVDGALRACALQRGDEPGAERLARAFLAAAGGLPPVSRLAAQLFYPRRVRWLDEIADLEPGREGIALVRRDAPPVLLMPQVARDHKADAHGMLSLLLDKAGLPAPPAGARLVAWTVETVVARDDRRDLEAESAREAARSGATAADYAAASLVRMIDARGQVAFALDPRSRVLQPSGPLWHARSAIAIEALAAYGGTPAIRRAVARARRWLGDDLGRALRGHGVAGWPADRASVAGTLALACLAGVPVHARLRELVDAGRWRELDGPGWPWHAGQVALALRRDTPRDLWQRCTRDLARHPFAPYFALAARACGDEPAYRRAAAAVAGFIRTRPPFIGAAAATVLPETGLTAVAAHALAGAQHRAEHAAAVAFVHARQLPPERIPAALDPVLALGGFAATPVDDTLRADIAGHALLALLAR